MVVNEILRILEEMNVAVIVTADENKSNLMHVISILVLQNEKACSLWLVQKQTSTNNYKITKKLPLLLWKSEDYFNPASGFVSKVL